MYRLALRQLGGDAALAEDVVHEAWMRAVARLSHFRGDSTLRTWLCGFVIRIVRESLRDHAAADGTELPEHGADDARLSGAVDRVDLEHAIAALPAGFRQVLILHDVEGYTHEEIAALLGIVTGTSKSQLARARAALRAALRPGG